MNDSSPETTEWAKGIVPARTCHELGGAKHRTRLRGVYPIISGVPTGPISWFP